MLGEPFCTVNSSQRDFSRIQSLLLHGVNLTRFSTGAAWVQRFCTFGAHCALTTNVNSSPVLRPEFCTQLKDTLLATQICDEPAINLSFPNQDLI